MPHEVPREYPVAFYELEDDDEVVVCRGEDEQVVRVGAYHDDKGRIPRFLVEQVDGDRFFFTNEDSARAFMQLHGLMEVGDEQMEALRQQEEA